MKQFTLTLCALLLGAAFAAAQTARVQVIHNAPNPTVDVYVNGALAIDNFAFRTARPFLDLPAGLPLSIAVAPENSASVADAIATFPATFESGKKYTVTASGIVGSTTTPFTLITDANALEVAAAPTKVSVNVLHGAPDAPAVDVVVRTGPKVVANLAYGEFTPYLSLDPGVYYLDVKPAGSSAIVGTFKADLSTFAGRSLRVMASGLLSGSPSFGLYAVAADGTVLELPNTPVARVQVLHNSPDQTVDVWANDTKLLDDFKFLTATPFIYVPAEVPLNLGVAAESSVAVQDTFYHTQATLVNGKTYLVTALGIPSDLNAPFRLAIFDQAREVAADTNQVDLAFQHGSVEFSDPLDFRENYLNATFGNDLTFGQTSGYSAFAPGVGDFGIFLQPSGISLKEGRAVNLAKGSAGVVFATTDPTSTPSRQLRLLGADGSVTLLGEPKRANLQVIHNSPSPRVDIYYGGNLVFDNADFRHYNDALTYSDRAATLSIAPDTSTSVKSAIATFSIGLEQGKNTAAYVDGVVGDAATPLTLNTREIKFGPLSGQVEISVHHGAPGAPAVDVSVVGAGNIFTDLAYGQNSGFVAVSPGVYQVQVKKAGTNESLGIFDADLSAWGGQSLNIFASGFADKTPDFGLFFSVLDGNTPPEGLPAYELPRVQALTKAQIIHNAASPTVDVYANGVKLLDDFKYRTATPFVDVPAGVSVSIAIAPETSASVADAIATFNVVFDESKKYVVTASGIVGSTSTPFTLLVNDAAQTESADPSKVAVAVLHGSTDAPAVDVDAVFVSDNVVNNLAYGNYTGYLSLDPTKYDLAVRPTGNAAVVASFRADLSGLDGGAATVFASGTLSGTPAFGLFAALANGTVIALPLTPTARVQIIHNSPDPTVDVYAGNTLLLNDFAFRTATPFVTVPADRDVDFGVAGASSTSAADALATFSVNFESGKTYAVFANGIVGNAATPFTLLADVAREAAADPSKVEFAVLHGAPGAPAVDVDVRLGTTAILSVPGLAYEQFTPYVGLDPDNYLIRVKPAGSNTAVGTYIADLSLLGGAAARVFASGILGGTPGFGLFAALPDGTVVEFPLAPPPPSARVQIIHNAASPTVDIYANGDLLLNDFQYRTATPFVDLPAEVDLSIAVAPGNSTSVADAIATFPVTLDKTKKYVVTASGIVGDPTTPFTLIVNDMGREAAAVPGTVSISVLHGSTNAPAVDVDEILTGNVLTNLAYSQFTPYLDLAPGIYDLGVRATGTPDPVAIFRADLRGLAGGAATVFASGLVGGTPGFGLFAALPNGVVVELPIMPTARVQIIHNSPSPTVDVYAGNAKLVDDFVFRTATPFVDVPADRDFRVSVALGTSGSVADTLVGFPVNFASGKRYTVFANGIVGNVATPFTLAVNDAALESAAAGFVAVSAFHGSPGAPNVDVVERQAGPLFQNVAYGQYTPYLNLPPGEYYLDVKAAGTPGIVATYFADLSGLNGQALRVFASGVLGGSPAFGLFAALPSGVVVELPLRPVARVQILHNAPSPTVDVYVFNQKVLEDFEFRTATPFFYIPAEFPLPIGVAPGNSQSVNDVIATFPTTFKNGGTYVVAASGLVGGSPAFNLIVNEMGRERAQDISKIELAVLHGIPDAPAVDIQDYFTDLPVLSNLQYGDFTDYLAIDPDVLIVRGVVTASPQQTVGIWGGDLTQGAGLAGVLFATGQLADDSYDLWLLLPDGTTLPLAGLSEGQVIHDALSAGDGVDVYFEGDKILDDFEFRTATGYGLFPARAPFSLAVAPGNSQSVNDAIFTATPTLRLGKTYTIVAGGIVGGTPAFNLFVNENARRTALNTANTEFNLFHGAPDAPEVDVTLFGGSPVLFDNVEFGEFTDYLSVPPANYSISVTPANNNNQPVQSYRADISGLGGEAFTVFASGLLGGTPSFEVWVALADGTTFPLPTLVSTNELDEKLSDFAVSPNPAVDEVNIRFSLTEPEALRYGLRDVTGRLVQEGDFGTVSAGTFVQRLDVSQLPSGMYSLEVVSDSGVRSVKVVVAE